MVTIASRFRDRSTNIGQWRKSSSLNEKGTVVGMDYLETSPYNVFEREIYLLVPNLFAVNVDNVDFASLTFPRSKRCRESL